MLNWRKPLFQLTKNRLPKISFLVETKATKELGVKKVEGKPGDMKAKQSTEVHY